MLLLLLLRPPRAGDVALLRTGDVALGRAVREGIERSFVVTVVLRLPLDGETALRVLSVGGADVAAGLLLAGGDLGPGTDLPPEKILSKPLSRAMLSSPRTKDVSADVRMSSIGSGANGARAGAGAAAGGARCGCCVGGPSSSSESSNSSSDEDDESRRVRGMLCLWFSSLRAAQAAALFACLAR